MPIRKYSGGGAATDRRQSDGREGHSGAGEERGEDNRSGPRKGQERRKAKNGVDEDRYPSVDPHPHNCGRHLGCQLCLGGPDQWVPQRRDHRRQLRQQQEDPVCREDDPRRLCRALPWPRLD